MARSQWLTRTCILTILCAIAVEGRVLASLRGQLWAGDNASHARTLEMGSADSNPAMEKQYQPNREVTTKKLEGKEKYPILLAMHNRLETIFGRFAEPWWMDWKLWVGLIFWFSVWVRWLTHGFDEIYYQRALFAFGINIVILHILQYAPSIKVGMLVICGALACQSMFQSYMWFKEEAGDHLTPRSEEFNCDTLYLDLALPFEQIFILFVAQLGVWWFYMTSILGNFDFNNVNYLFWLWAFLAMQTDSYSFALKDAEDEKGGQFRMRKANIIARGVMGFFCNSILREIMAYTIPLMLMGFSEPMDFVVYCVGVNFICTLDDMSDKKFAISSRTIVDTSD